MPGITAAACREPLRKVDLVAVAIEDVALDLRKGARIGLAIEVRIEVRLEAKCRAFLHRWHTAQADQFLALSSPDRVAENQRALAPVVILHQCPRIDTDLHLRHEPWLICDRQAGHAPAELITEKAYRTTAERPLADPHALARQMGVECGIEQFERVARACFDAAGARDIRQRAPRAQLAQRPCRHQVEATGAAMGACAVEKDRARQMPQSREILAAVAQVRQGVDKHCVPAVSQPAPGRRELHPTLLGGTGIHDPISLDIISLTY